MAYKFQDELTQRAEQFIASLRQAGIDGATVPNSFRNYSVKVSIRKAGQFFGNANLFYSPTKDRFSLKTHELKDASIEPDLERSWNQIDLTDSTADTKPVGVAPHGLQVYVDGSFIDGKIGYAFVVLQDGGVAHEHCGQVQDDWLLDMHQVGGEIKAVLEGVAWCAARGITAATVCYDYAGIEHWITGHWTAAKLATRRYVQLAAEWPVAVRWRKVQSHSGDRWNDYVDRLAGQGARQDAAAQNPTAVILEKANQFASLLRGQGVACSVSGIMNGQYVRISFGAASGALDIYNSKNRPLNKPDLRGFADAGAAERLERQWQAFLAGDAPAPPAPDVLAEATYYWQVLQPYQGHDFDFVELADALERACRMLDRPNPLDEAARYDFPALHALLARLQKEQL